MTGPPTDPPTDPPTGPPTGPQLSIPTSTEAKLDQIARSLQEMLNTLDTIKPNFGSVRMAMVPQPDEVGSLEKAFKLYQARQVRDVVMDRIDKIFGL